mmetsp:Transcript_19944/g.29977  ORF Transcript_19944/g.29977 Transcript_19944/m.29977 type:complete len:211 (+) Transcript_19944:138-770(+)
MTIAYGFNQPAAFFGNISIKPFMLDFKESGVHLIREEQAVAVPEKHVDTHKEVHEQKKSSKLLTLVNVLERYNDWDRVMMKEKAVESRDEIPTNVHSHLVDFNPTKSNKTSKKWKSSKKLVKSKKVTAKKPSKIPPSLVFEGADENLPNGWTKKVFKRNRGATKSRLDTYWFSPRMKNRFRSRTEVKKFLDCLRISEGDEVAAYAAFKNI